MIWTRSLRHGGREAKLNGSLASIRDCLEMLKSSVLPSARAVV